MGRIEFVGVDGCPSGWFSVGFDTIGGYELKVFPAFSELLDYYRDAKLVLVDIPIGLPEGPGGRECDQEARKKLRPHRSSSVFSAPTRQTVQKIAETPDDYGAEVYRAAGETEHQYARRGISKQTFAISHKIAQVDESLSKCRTRRTPNVREVHPEICFWALNNKRPMKYRKKSKSGQVERIRVLKAIEPRTEAIFQQGLSDFLRKCVARDDILDALVAAVTARCGFGRLRTIPECPPTDCKGLPMEMVYWEA